MDPAAIIEMTGIEINRHMSQEYVDFKVDRPFLFFIKEKSTNLIFIAGIMNEIK